MSSHARKLLPAEVLTHPSITALVASGTPTGTVNFVIGTGAALQADARVTGTGTGVSGIALSTALTGPGSLGLTIGDVITVSDGTNQSQYTVAGGDNVSDLIAALSNVVGGANCTVSIVGGHLQVQGNDFTSTITMTDNASPLSQDLTALGFTLGTREPQSAIVAVIMPDLERGAAMWEALLHEGLYVNLARPPATPAGMTLLRCSLCAEHSSEEVETILGMFERAGKAVGII